MIQEGGDKLNNPDNDLPSLFVGDLDHSIYDSELFNFFKRNGFKPKKVKVILDKRNNRHKGFAYVAFFSQEQADGALAKL